MAAKRLRIPRGGEYFARIGPLLPFVAGLRPCAPRRAVVEHLAGGFCQGYASVLGEESCTLYKAVKRDEVETFLRVISPWSAITCC